MPTYTLRIRRYVPESGLPPYWSDYQVELDGHRSVLDGILDVKDREDGSIGVRCSCKAAICGSCGVRINGQAKLACNTKLEDALERAQDGAIVVEPMGNMPVLKDLIVAAINECGRKVDEEVQSKVSGMTSGMKLPFPGF